MERRKIILFGKTAFCVTLPQSWVKKNKLQKGDSLRVQETPRNSLELIPSLNTPEDALTIELQIAERPTEGITSFLLATYLNGYSTIVLVGQNAGKMADIRKYLHKLIATEVMEISTNKIVINMLWDMASMDPHTIINRIDNILKTIFAETKGIFSSDANAKDVMEKGYEVQRQVLLTRRILTHALNNSSAAQRFNLSTLELYYLSSFVYFLGKIGEYIVDLSTLINAVKNSEDFDLEARYESEKLLLGLAGYFENVIDAYYKQSKGAQFIFQGSTGFEADLSVLQKRPVAAMLADRMKRILVMIKDLEMTLLHMETSPR